MILSWLSRFNHLWWCEDHNIQVQFFLTRKEGDIFLI